MPALSGPPRAQARDESSLDEKVIESVRHRASLETSAHPKGVGIETSDHRRASGPWP